MYTNVAGMLFFLMKILYATFINRQHPMHCIITSPILIQEPVMSVLMRVANLVTGYNVSLRNLALFVGNLKDTALSNFFKRIAFRKGRPAAISATARKLAVIIWNMIVKCIPYKPATDYEFLDQKRKRKVQEMKKLIHKFDIKINELGLHV